MTEREHLISEMADSIIRRQNEPRSNPEVGMNNWIRLLERIASDGSDNLKKLVVENLV